LVAGYRQWAKGLLETVGWETV